MFTKQPVTDTYIVEAEYLEGEKQAEERHEYVNGRVYALAGASKRHNRIARNFITRLGSAADEAGCELFFSDIKVRSEKHKTYYYPDVVLGCDEDSADDYYLEKPCLIIEVTSASTLRKDYLEKALSYQSIASLQAYLIVAQDKPQVDMLVRDDDAWLLRQFDDAEAVVDLPCLNVSLSLAEIYAGVEPG
jgi:Uma2 family endonuclease